MAAMTLQLAMRGQSGEPRFGVDPQAYGAFGGGS